MAILDAAGVTFEGTVPVAIIGAGACGLVAALAARDAGAEVLVEVADTGIGIGQAHLDKLFTPFLQEDHRLNRRYQGVGLGLALVKRLLDVMDGRIEVESEKGKGSTFRVFLPAAGG